jgi:hypothetical protein
MSEAAEDLDDKHPIDAELEEAAGGEGEEGGAKESSEEAIRVATLMGWKPKDQWKGDTANWRPAEDFLSEVPEVLRNTRKANERLNGQVTRIVAQVAKLDRRSDAQASAIAEAEAQEAFEAGDFDKAKKILLGVGKGASAQPDEPAAFTDFKARNDWYGVDDEASAYVEMLDKRFVQAAGGPNNVDPEAHFKKIEAGVKKRFPELFEDGDKGGDDKGGERRQERRAPLVTRGRGLDRGRSGGAMSVADLSPAQRQAIKVMGVTEADYVKSYNQLNKAS